MPLPTTTEALSAAGAAAAAGVGVAGTVTYAALSAGSQLFGRTLIAGSDPNEVALTFDDGPNDAATEALLELFAEHGVRATFFMIGAFVAQRKNLARRVHAAGHLLGNHTQSHPWLQAKPAHQIFEELRACNQVLEDALGAPVRYFRPPHGARRPFVLRAARELGLETVQWNILAGDWKPDSVDTLAARVDRGLRKCQRQGVGANLVLHDGGHEGIGADRTRTVELTAKLLARFGRERRKLVTVDAWSPCR